MFRTTALIACWLTLATTASATVLVDIVDTANNSSSVFAENQPISLDLEVLVSNPDDAIAGIQLDLASDAPLVFSATPVFSPGFGFLGQAVNDAPGDPISGATWIGISLTGGTIPVGGYNDYQLLTLSAQLNSGLPVGTYQIGFDNALFAGTQSGNLPVLANGYTLNVVPEPSSMLLLGLGAVGCLVGARLRRRRLNDRRCHINTNVTN